MKDMTAINDAPPRRSDFVYFTTLQTRWSDNDMMGHLNNVIYTPCSRR